MKVINIANIKDSSILYSAESLRYGANFLDFRQCKEVVDASDNNIDTVIDWFNTIGIRYDSINFYDNTIVYSVNGEQLGLSSLSSGERIILYLIACKKLNKSLIVHGLFERLGSRLTNIAINLFKDYSNLTVVCYNRMPYRN